MNVQALLEENEALHARVADYGALKEESSQKQKKIDQLEAAYAELARQFEWFKKQLFGKKSERIVEDHPDQLTFEGFDSAPPEKAQATAVKNHRRQKRKGQDRITLPNDIPIERRVIDLPESEKICPKTGKPYPKIGEEITTKLACKPASFFLKQTIRPKYAIEEGVRVADLPDGILKRCQADHSLLADIIIKKFGDHLPLSRISEIYARSGVTISRQLLSQWLVKVGEVLEPLHTALYSQVIATRNIFIDETPVKVLSPGKGKAHQAYMWEVASRPGCITYHFRLNRQHKNLYELINGYTGVIHSDKYDAYKNAAKRKEITWCPCWSHIRRYFIDAGESPFQKEILRRIKHLFMCERVALSRPNKERVKIRRRLEEPIIDHIVKSCEERLKEGHDLPKSGMGKALRYFMGLKPHLKNYIKCPQARLDNNFAERMIRPLAIGRRNWLFMGSEAGGKAAGVLLSLVQSCRSLGVNPHDYLMDVFERYQGHSYSKLEELLPRAWAKDRGLLPDG